VKHAQVVTVTSAAAAREMLTAGTLDAFASTKPSAPRIPGARMLPGRAGIEELAAAVPLGREQGAEFLRDLVKTLRAEGFFNQAIDRAGLQGVLRD
jgi:polar amino acid transport system substrate-binding protein